VIQRNLCSHRRAPELAIYKLLCRRNPCADAIRSHQSSLYPTTDIPCPPGVFHVMWLSAAHLGIILGVAGSIFRWYRPSIDKGAESKT
jgi:hypothetical protein